MVLVGAAVGVALALVAVLIPWLPPADSTEAIKIDDVYWFVTIICIAIFALVAGVSLYAVWKFRAPPDDTDDGAPIHGHTGLEVVWTSTPVTPALPASTPCTASAAPSGHRGRLPFVVGAVVVVCAAVAGVLVARRARKR